MHHHHLIQLLPRLLPALLFIFLTLRVGATSIPVPGGLIGWWTGDSNSVDLVSGSTATLGTTTYTTNAEVGAAFNFNGTSATAGEDCACRT